jgi:hypothetical protein
MKYKLTWSIALLAVLLFAGTVPAETEFGGNINWNQFHNANQGDLAVGARAGFSLSPNVSAVTSFDYYFVDAQSIFNNRNFNSDSSLDLKFWELNENLIYTFPTSGVRPYFGSGVGWARRTFNDVLDTNPFNDDRNKLGFNVLGGVRFGSSAWQPFTEVRGTFYRGNSFRDRFIWTGGVIFVH